MAGVQIDVEQIPSTEAVLQVLRLDAPSTNAGDFALDLGASLGRDVERRELGPDATGVYAGETLVAYASRATGEARVFPQLSQLEPGRDLAERGRGAALELLRNTDLFSDDRTDRLVEDSTVLHGSLASKRRESVAQEYLAHARIRRQINGIDVVGAGSQATVMASSDGTEAVSVQWRAAQQIEEVSGTEINRREVALAIIADLETVAGDREVRVDSVELVYHDGDAELIQPVYRYHASYRDGDGPQAHLVGLVPALKAFEDLPITIVRPSKLPKEAKPERPARLRTNHPTIGRYVVRNDDAGWVTSANTFMDGLRLAGLFTDFSPVDRQYYWAEPRLFTDENHSFVDSVQVALTEVHGDWSIFSTLMNSSDLVRLSDIPTDGYGGAAGAGALAYWILHSCEVIPTSFDTTTSYDVWWNVFNGLHAALGYRTEMYINDQITHRLGFFAGLGAPMVSNWLSTVIDDDSYGPSDTYLDGHVNAQLPMGRPSAVNVMGHADDTIRDVGPLPRPTVLQQWWYGN